MSAAYSKTPLAKKLGVRSGDLVTILGSPPGWSIEGLPDDVRVIHRKTLSTSGPLVRIVLLFTRSAQELRRRAKPAAVALRASSALWVAWPRRAGGHVSDVTESNIRDVLLPVGVVDVKVAALDDDWSGLKFVWRMENRSRA